MARLKFPGRPGQRFGRVSVKYKHDHHKLQPESTFCVADNINVRLKVFNDIFGDSDEDEDFGGFSYWDIKKAQNICNQVKEEKCDEAPRRGKRTVVRRSYAHMIRHGFSPSEVKSVKRNSEVKREKAEENSDSTSSNDNNNSNSEKFPIGKLKIRIDRGGKKARIISNSSSNSSIDENIKNDENVDIPPTGNGENVMKKVEKMVAHRLLNRAKQSKEKKLDNEMMKKDIDKSSECIDEKRKDPEVEEIAKSPQFSTSSPRRKAFVLPARSARSSRLIIPRKRLMEEFDCTALKYQVSRKPIDDNNRLDAGKVNKKSDLVSINSDKQRPSLKMKMKISSLIPEKSNLTTETQDCEGNLTKRIEQDISKYADTMARKKGGKIRNKSANSPVFSSNSTGVDATSSGVAAKFSEEECDGVTARIEKMLRSQWDGRLRKPNGKRSSDEEIAASKQRASTQRRTKNILRKARLQLNKRTLMKLRQPASVRKLSEQFLKDQSEVHTSVKLNRFPTVSLEPMDAFLKQTKSLSCVVCSQTNNFCLVNEHFGQMCCEYCLKFYMGSMTEEFVCENKVNVGNCVMKPNVLGQLLNCKYCWLQNCLKKFKTNDKENSTNSTDAIKNEVEENTPSLPLPKANGVDEVKTLMSKPATTVLRRSRGRPKVKMAEAEQTEIKTEQISPPNERGPRIKHVCRRASVVLGFQRATFPSSSTIGMAHKALKKAKRIKAGVSRVQRRKEKEPAPNPDHEEEEEEEEEEIKAEVDENDTEDQDYTELKQQKVRRKSTFGTKRKVRCKKCTNCTRKDCGKCTFCVDMRKFGGRQVLKQCCMHRKCLNPLYKGTSKSTNKNLKIRGSNQNSDGGDSHSSLPKRTGKELEGSQRVVLSSSSKKAGLPTCGVSAGEMMDGDDELWPLAITGCDAKKRKANFAHNVFVPRPVKQKEKERTTTQRLSPAEVFIGASIRARQNFFPHNSLNLVQDGSKNKELVNVDYWEDYDPDEIWNFGRALISAHPFPIRIVCFLCGSGGQYEMIYCILCCEAFHRFCLEAEDVPLPENVENWCCRKCQTCNFCGTKNNLLKCFKCQNTYHAQCLGPNYPSKPSKKKKIWMCTKCVKCKSCGATSPGTSSGAQWMFDFSLCYDCGRLTEKGNYCPLCQKCYEDDDYDSKMVQCMECKSWIHAKCDDMTDEMYQIISYLPESVVYTCRKCTPERPPTWLVAVEAELKAGLILVLSAVTSAKCAKHLVHGKVKDKSKLDYSSSASSSTTSSPVKSAETTLTACEDNCPESDSEKKNILLPQLQDDNLSDLMDVDLTDYLQLPSTELFTDVSLDKNSSCEISDFNLDPTQNLFGKNLVPEFDFNMGFSSGESSLEKSQKELIIEENVRNCISLMDSDVMATLDQQLEKENNNGAQCDEIICDSSRVASVVENEEKKKNFQNESGLEWREFDGFFKKSKNNHRKNKRIIYFDFKEGQPQDLQTVQENVKKAHYTTVRLFCEDVIRVIRSGGVNGKKGNTRAIKTIFVKQMEKIFPWFAVTSPSLWGQFDTRHRLLPEAVVPPNSDHNYAQYLDKEPDEFDQPSLFTVSSPHSVMDEFGDCRWCILCSDVGDGEPDEVGRLLYCGQDDWIHLNCAVWSAEVFQEVDGSLQNVHAAITRGRVMKCELCNLSGATVGCCLSGCRANYHFMCARKANAIFQEDKKVYCSAHRNKANDKILTKEFTVSHSVYVDLESLFPKWAKKTWQKGLHPSCISILAGAMMIEQLGTLSALSDTPEALIPINFQCTRVYWSTTNPRRRVVYTLKTIEVRPETAEETEVIEHVTTVHEQEEKLESSEKVGNTETSKDSEKTEKFEESCAAETNEDKDMDKDNPEKEDLINRQNMDKTTLNEKIENEITESTLENENTKDGNTICINSAQSDEKTMSQIKSEVVDFLRDILVKIDLEVKKELMDEVKNEPIKEENVEEVKEKITSNGHLKNNICAESVVLLTPLCKKKLTGLKLSDSCQRAIGKKIRKNWGLEPLKKYPVRSTRYRAELVEPVINGRKIKVKEVKCEEERPTPRVRHLSGRRCLKTQDSPQNGLILKPKRYNFRSKERSMVSSKENQFANSKVELDICEKQKCDDEQDGDGDEMSCKNESTKGSDTECVVVANHRNATASLMQVQKSCSVKLKRIPSILRVRKVTINGLDGADETLGLEDPPIRNEVVTVEGKNGTSCCITRACGGNLERMKKMCALNQDDNHNIVEPVEVADKKDEEPDCQQSNGFCSNENSVENHLQHTQNHVESNASTDLNHQTSSELNFKPNNAEPNKDTGPFKCNKCKCLYRTMESCKRHMATCNFEVETTSSEDESLSPKSTGSQSSTGKRKLTSDEESGCKKRRKLFEDCEENVNNDIKEEIIDPPVEKEIVEPPLVNETVQSSLVNETVQSSLVNETVQSSLVKETQIEPFTPPTPNPARVVTQRRLLLPKPQEQQPEVKQQQDETAFTQVYQVPMGTPVVFSVNDMNTVTPLETVMEPLHVTYVGSVNVNQGQLACLPSVMSMPSYTVLDNNLLQPCIAQNSWDNSSPLQLHIVNQAVTSTPIVNHQQHVIPQFTPTVTYVNNHQQHHQQNVVQVANEQLASLLSRAIVESTSKKTVPVTSTPVRKAKPVLQTYSRKLQNIAPKTEASGSKCTVTSSTVSSGSCDIDSSPLLALYQQQERLKMTANSVGQQQQQQLQPHIVYQISSEDGFFVQTNNVNEAWRTVAERVQDARAAAKLKYVPVDGVNGINMSGLGQNAVQYILEQMPQAKTCQKYRFRFHEQEIVEEIPENPTGCARSEPFHTRKEYDMFNFLASKHRRPPDGRNGPEEEEMQHKSSRRATSMDLPMAMRFRHLRQTAREAVGVYRSKIHGRGLFCKRCIDVGEMVIEYAGEVIRSVLTDMREKYYESKGIGCYMFRIDDNEVVDATMHGNAARFINHSCEPNCYSKVITVDGKKHIIIFALRRINRGEELTYDYKFPIEDIKIPCTCGSRRCRKYLN